MKQKSIRTIFWISGFIVIVLLILNSCEKKSMTGATEKSEVTMQLTATTGVGGNGVNLQPSYFCNGDQNLGWPLMKANTKIKSVRLEMDPTSGSTISDFSRWIQEANANGFFVIATYHEDADLGSNDPAKLMNAANWWKNNYSQLSAAGSFVINLMNEWGDHNITSSAYASAYNSAISVVRQVYAGFIICDIPGWGQECYTAANAAPLITDSQIIFSAHVYPSAWVSTTGAFMQTADLDYLGNSGRPCMLGEFGPYGSGSANWSTLVDHAKAKGWTVMGWCWNGDGSSPKKMNMISPYWGDRKGCSTTNYTKSSYWSIIYNKL